MTRAFHIFLALVVALPLGAGGLCCCLFAVAGDLATEVARAAAVPACCASASVPATPQGSCPAGDGDVECDCPSRDSALVEAPFAGKLLPVQVSTLAMIEPAHDSVGRIGPVHPSLGTRVPHPPPKQPLYRTLAALRC